MNTLLFISMRRNKGIAWLNVKNHESGWLNFPIYDHLPLKNDRPLRGPYGLLCDDLDPHCLYIADKFGNAVRSFKFQCLNGSPKIQENIDFNSASFHFASFNSPSGITRNPCTGEIVLSVAGEGAIYKLLKKNGEWSQIAGKRLNETYRINGFRAYVPSAEVIGTCLYHPVNLCIAATGSIYFIERGFQSIRKISQYGDMHSLFPRDMRSIHSSSWEPPVDIKMSSYHPAFPTSLVCDNIGTLYIADAVHRCVWSCNEESKSMRCIYKSKNENGGSGPSALYIQNNILWILDQMWVMGLDINQASYDQIDKIKLSNNVLESGCLKAVGTGMTGYNFSLKEG